MEMNEEMTYALDMTLYEARQLVRLLEGFKGTAVPHERLYYIEVSYGNLGQLLGDFKAEVQHETT